MLARTADMAAERKRRFREKARVKKRTLAIVRAYQAGESASAIGRRFGINANSVYQAVGRLRRRCEEAILSISGGESVLRRDIESGQHEPGLDHIIKNFAALHELNVSREQSDKFLSQHPKEQ